MSSSSFRHSGSVGAFIVLVFALALIVGGIAHAGKFTDASLGPRYGCLVNIGSVGTELIQITSDKKGHLTAGSMKLNASGEGCHFPVTSGTYTINADGTGTMDVTLGMGTDPDGDTNSSGLIINCANISNATEHFEIVLETNGQRIEMSAADDFFTGGGFTGADAGDLIFFGSCTRQ